MASAYLAVSETKVCVGGWYVSDSEAKRKLSRRIRIKELYVVIPHENEVYWYEKPPELQKCIMRKVEM